MRASDFGDIDSIEYFDDERTIGSFKDMIDYYVEKMGYVKGETVRAAGYDWRLGPG